MAWYEIDLISDGARTPIDNITAPAGYTAADYVRDCEANADEDWCEMLRGGQVVVIEVEN